MFVLAGALAVGGCATPRDRRVASGNDLYVKGALAYQEGDRERAMAALQSAIQQNPDLIMARFLLGNIHRDRNEYAAAAQVIILVDHLET
jgi:tetratricopeptide (TPR) repeat protein